MEVSFTDEPPMTRFAPEYARYQSHGAVFLNRLGDSSCSLLSLVSVLSMIFLCDFQDDR